MKELYIKAYEELELELDREPSDEEIQERVEDYQCRAYDRAKDLRKYGE